MKPLVIANWKMNLTGPQVVAFLERFVPAVDSVRGAEVLVAPSFPSLQAAAALLAGTGVGVAAQDLFPEDRGAFTGAVSGPMLAAAGCSHVLVGHSERRRIFAEDDALLRRKLDAAWRHRLQPVLCVGETADEHRAGRTTAVVERQLRAALERPGGDAPGPLAVAYEPVWAIGTGESATPEQAAAVHDSIRALLGQILPAPAVKRTPVLYGGSVNADTAADLMARPSIQGLLVGTASLDPDSFTAICAAAGGAP